MSNRRKRSRSIGLAILRRIETLENRLVFSHFRYGELAWEPASTTSTETIEFHVEQAWRRTFFGGGSGPGGVPDVGDVINTGTLEFGDGSSAPVDLRVLSINPVEDWFFGEAVIDDGAGGFLEGIVHTYAAPGNVIASFEGSARISTLENNADGNYRNETMVNVGSTNSSPVTSLPPIVQVADDTVASFVIPVADPDGDSLTFRLASSQEAAGVAAYSHPPGLAVDSNTGRVTWDILDASQAGVAIGQLWTTQLIIEDHDAAGAVRSKIPVDFILQVVAMTGAAPVFDSVPTGTLNVAVGQPLQFVIQASDPDASDTITLQALNPPQGMTFAPVPASSGSSANALALQASWTPPQQQQDATFVVSFQASDSTGLTNQAAVTITVTGNTSPIANDDNATTTEGIPVDINVLANDVDPDGTLDVATVQISTAPGHGTATVDSMSGVVTYTPADGFSGTDSLAYTVKDNEGDASNTATVSITVQPAGSARQFAFSTSVGGVLTNSDGSTLAFDDSDIVLLSVEASGRYHYELYFDGSDVGLTTDGEDIDAFDILPDGSILISTVGRFSVPWRPQAGKLAHLQQTGYGEDILRFTPRSSGDSTAGDWDMFFDGSRHGLSGAEENIDAVSRLFDGTILVSTAGNVKVSGVSASDADLLIYNPQLKKWAVAFDGSDVGLSAENEDIDAVFVTPLDAVLHGNNLNLFFSTRGNFAVDAVSGADEDVVRFAPKLLGPITIGQFSSALTLDGSQYGLSAFDLDGIHLGPVPSRQGATQFATLAPVAQLKAAGMSESATLNRLAVDQVMAMSGSAESSSATPNVGINEDGADELSIGLPRRRVVHTANDGRIE